MPTPLSERTRWLGLDVDHDPCRGAAHDLVTTLRGLARDLATTDAEAADLPAVEAVLAQARALREGVGALPRLATTPARADLPASFLFERSPVSGRMNAVAPPVAISIDDNGTTGLVTYTEQYEGPAGGVHGGVIAAAFDELLGVAQMATDRPGYTASLEIRYRSITPLHVPITYEAWIVDQDGPRLVMGGRSTADGRLCAEATGVFARPNNRTIDEGPAHRQGARDEDGLRTGETA